MTLPFVRSKALANSAIMITVLYVYVYIILMVVTVEHYYSNKMCYNLQNTVVF